MSADRPRASALARHPGRYGVYVGVTLLIVIALAALLVAGAALAWATRGSRRASAAEARDRAADLSAEFWDWIRLGR